VVVAAGLLAALAALTVMGGPVTDYTGATAAQLFDPQQYIAAVMGETSGGRR
jgi:multicomponent K+:H+ antiporter subunit D